MANRVRILILICSIVAGGWAQNTPGPKPDNVNPVVGPGVHVAELVQGVPVKVPAGLAKLRRVTALLVVVGADGTPIQATIANDKESPTDDAAIDAVMGSRFAAGTFKHKPVATELMVYTPFLGNDQPVIPIAEALNARVAKQYSSMSVVPPVPILTPAAQFTEEARERHIDGLVLVQVLISETGRMRKVRVVKSLGYGLDEVAAKAVSQYVFKPATLDGIPVPVLMTVTVNFRLFQ